MEPERPERVVEHQLRRLGAVAVAPRVRLADRDVVERRAVLAVELAEGAGPDQAVGRLLVDGHRQRVGPDDPGREEALDLLGSHRRRLVARQAGDLGVRVPAQERGDVPRDVPAQDDPRADQGLREPPSAAPFSARYTIARMRRWSELAERLAATTRTSEKTALLADYLRTLTPDELPVAAVFLTGRPFAEADQRAAGLGWSAIATTVTDIGARPARGARRGVRPLVRPGIAVAEVLRTAGHAPPPETSPTLPEVAAAFGEIEAASGPARKSAHPAQRCSNAPTRLTAKYIVKVLGGDLRIGLREGLVEAAIAKAFDRPLDDVKWAGMLVGDVGRLAALARDDGLATRFAGALPPAQVHARLAGRGRRRDHHPPRSRGLGRGQVRRHPGAAPQARAGGPALLARPARHQQRLPGDRRGGHRAAAVGRHPRWRDPRLARRDGPAVHRAPGPARAQDAVGRDPGRGPGHLRRLRRPGASGPGGGAAGRAAAAPAADRAARPARRARPPAGRPTAAGSPARTSSRPPTPTRSRRPSPIRAAGATRA